MTGGKEQRGRLIDDEGQLFGVVNVIDVLAIVFIVGVLIAGVALLSPFAASETETRYATVDLGESPPYIAEQVTEGDVMLPANADGNVTVTDVYTTPADEVNESVIVRVEIEGELVESDQHGGTVFEYQDTPVRPGGSFTVDTPGYELEGTVVSVDDDDPTLDTEEVPVTLVSTKSTSTARTLAADDTQTLVDSDIAELTDVYIAPGPDSETRTVVVGAQLEAVNIGGEPRFAGELIEIDREVTLATAEADFTGQLMAVGSDEVKTSERVVTVQTTVSPETAALVSAGDTYEIADRPVATVESAAIYPTADSSDRIVELEVRLETFEDQDGQQFGAYPVKLDESIPFETSGYSTTGTVVSTGPLSESGETRPITAEVKLENVPPERADAVEVGMQEQDAGATYATVTDKQVEPAAVVLESEDGHIYEREHPRNKDVSLTVDLQVQETSSGTFFHGERLQQGDRVVFDFGTVTLQGTVTHLDDE